VSEWSASRSDSQRSFRHDAPEHQGRSAKRSIS
jgi:hypothetical protein